MRCRERGHRLQEPQTSGHRKLSWEKKWHDSEGTQPGLQHPLLGPGLPRGCGERCCIPRLPLRAPCAPTIGPGKHQSRPCGALCPDVSSQQVLVSAWLGQTLDVTKGRESSHQAFSSPRARSEPTAGPRGSACRRLAQCGGVFAEKAVRCAWSGHLRGF